MLMNQTPKPPWKPKDPPKASRVPGSGQRCSWRQTRLVGGLLVAAVNFVGLDPEPLAGVATCPLGLEHAVLTAQPKPWMVAA